MGPVTPFIPAIIGGISSIGASALANKATGVNPGGVTTPLTQGMNLGITNAQQLMPQGTGLMTNAAQAMNPVLNYYGSLLSGDRGAMTQLLAPQINQLNQAYQAQLGAQNQLMPRGGGRAGMLGQMPFMQTQNLLNLFQNVRSGAAQGMGQAAGQLGQLGANLIGGANQALGAATSAGRDLLYYQIQQQAANRGLGSSIGGIAQQIAGGLLGGGGNPMGGINVGSVLSSMPLPGIPGSGMALPNPELPGTTLPPAPGIPGVTPQAPPILTG
jgi:hypothetical protein